MLMRRYLADILADPFALDAPSKAAAIRDYLLLRPDLLDEGEREVLAELLALVSEAQSLREAVGG